VLVKDRSIGPRDQVLNISIAYWCYGPSKPSIQPLIDAWLYPHCFIGWLRREDGYEPMDRSAAHCGLCRERFFLGVVGLLNSVDESLKVTTYGDSHRKRMSGVRGLAWEVYMVCWSGFLLRGVHRLESPRLSDMSNSLFVSVIT
jgi:hypothetical protein